MANDLNPLNELRRELGEQPAGAPPRRADTSVANTAARRRAPRRSFRAAGAGLAVLSVVTAPALAANNLWLAAAGAAAGLSCLLWCKRL